MTQAKRGNFFVLPNKIFSLSLDAYEFHVYSYLVSCAGQKGECWPSISTMARVLGMSNNTVIRKIDSLIQRRLIDKSSTTSKTRNGNIRTSNNHYHIRSLDEAIEHATRFRVG